MKTMWELLNNRIAYSLLNEEEKTQYCLYFGAISKEAADALTYALGGADYHIRPYDGETEAAVTSAIEHAENEVRLDLITKGQQITRICDYVQFIVLSQIRDKYEDI